MHKRSTGCIFCAIVLLNIQGLVLYRLYLENGLDQLIVTLYKLSIYPSVHKQLIRTLLKAQIV